MERVQKNESYNIKKIGIADFCGFDLANLLDKRKVVLKNRDGVILQYNLNKFEVDLIKENFKGYVFVDTK